MSAHCDSPSCPILPDSVPDSLRPTTRLSWELGSRVIEDAEASLESEWYRTEGGWRLSVYRVTNHTDILQLRTPAGRELFYGVTQAAFGSAVSALEAANSWCRASA